MYFSEDWDDDRKDGWHSLLYMDEKAAPKQGKAEHQHKFPQLEDAYNARWQVFVNLGR